MTLGKGKTERRHRRQCRVHRSSASSRSTAGAVERPASGETALAAPPAPAAAPAQLSTDDYVGDVADRTGFAVSRRSTRSPWCCVPDLMSAYQQGVIDLESVKAVQLGDDRALRADGRPDGHPRPATRPERPAGQGVARRQGRLRLGVRDAVLAVDQGRSTRPPALMIFLPPSGHVAGIWGRNDDTRGVHKAPANEVVRGAVEPGDPDHQERAGAAQPVGINCVRAFPGRGHPGLGAPDAVLRPGLAVPQRPPALQLPRGVHPQRHQLGGVRAQRRGAVGPDPAHHQRVPRQRVAQGRAVRRSHPTRPSS